MTEIALEMDRVYKRFRRGELHDSLRDLIPAALRRVAGKRRDPRSLAERDFWALEDVSFAVERGDAFGIIGSNGAGKSTILKILSRILRPTLGAVRVNGRLSALIEVSAGFHPDLTGRENIYLNGSILGLRQKDIRARFDEIVAFSGLEEFIDTPVKRYSSGMFARLGFSVAAHIDPDVLLVDEVLSVGDYAFQQRCMERLRYVVSSGATVIFVSHNLRAVSELCGRVLLLDHGHAAAEGPAKRVIAQYLRSFGPTRDPRPGAVCVITSSSIQNMRGENLGFESGEPASVTVSLRAQRKIRGVSVSIQVLNEDLIGVFDTSTERLGIPSLTLDEGEDATCRFDLRLHLAPGTYHVSLWLHKYSTQTDLDYWPTASTFFVTSTRDIRGIADLEPRAELAHTRSVPATR